MYFPDNMNFQYLFFSTYIGYFLQALPIALAVSAIYGFIRFRKSKEAVSTKLFSCIFVCYMTGLICLVIGLDPMRIFWYSLLYHTDSGMAINWFGCEIDLIPDFLSNINAETIGNFLMFLPFGILYPLSHKNTTWKKSVIVGLAVVAAIEVFQPVFGRAFDLNDIILNSLGIVVSVSIFMGIKNAIKK